MHQQVSQNNKLVDAEKARFRTVSPVTLYGHGVFTTIAVYDGRPFQWTRHWTRLADNASRLRIESPNESSVRVALDSLIEANKVTNGRARITVFARQLSGAWNLKNTTAKGSDFLIMTGDARPSRKEGLALTVSPYRLNTFSPISGIKSVNYLEHLFAWEEARERDFEEAVVFNERGDVVSGTRSNIFWVTEGRIHTPMLSSGALAGTTRALVLDLAEELSVPAIEGVYEFSDLADADEIFLTSTGLGIVPAHTFDFRRYTLSAGSVVVRLKEAFHQATLQDHRFL